MMAWNSGQKMATTLMPTALTSITFHCSASPAEPQILTLASSCLCPADRADDAAPHRATPRPPPDDCLMHLRRCIHEQAAVGVGQMPPERLPTNAARCPAESARSAYRQRRHRLEIHLLIGQLDDLAAARPTPETPPADSRPADRAQPVRQAPAAPDPAQTQLTISAATMNTSLRLQGMTCRQPCSAGVVGIVLRMRTRTKTDPNCAEPNDAVVAPIKPSKDKLQPVLESGNYRQPSAAELCPHWIEVIGLATQKRMESGAH